MKTTTLRPGLLVSLKTSITGGVAYKRVDLDASEEKKAAEGAEIAKWETTKVVEDAADFEAAVKARGAARSKITAICSASDFGLMCPAARELDLARAIEEAKAIADEHNAKATRTIVSVYTITGRVAADDAEAARAINSEVRGLLDEMQEGIKSASPEAIRAAANKARQLGQLLSDDASKKVEKAIDQARAAAREIVKRVQKSGELAATVVADCATAEIDAARFAFLDLDTAKPIETSAPAVPALDMAPAEHAASSAPSVPAVEL